MGEIGFDKLLLILVVVLLLFGARRLPEIGASLGKGIREFKRSVSDADGPGAANVENLPAGPGRLESSATSPPLAGEPKRLSD
jgi:sec-independent protein translocase protein TatA